MIDIKKYESIFLQESEPTINWLKAEYSKLSTGVANPAILDSIKVEAYDDLNDINHIANLSIPDARTIIIKPFDKSILKNIVSAINAANIGINPQLDADSIRLSFPAPTEENRKQNVKKAKEFFETAKERIRKVRQHLQDLFKHDENSVDDDKKYFQNELDNMTKSMNKKLEDIFLSKEKDIMRI